MAKESSPFQASAASPAPSPARANTDTPRPPSRHQLRAPEEYVELEEDNRLTIPRNLWPDGFALQWVTNTVYGKPETQHRARYERQGWVSVLATEFNGLYGRMFMPDGHQGEVELDGLVLMARDLRWSKKAEAIQLSRARERVHIKERQLLSGDLGKVTLAPDHPTALRTNSIGRTVEQISVIPD
jgi:hypothetical protein